MTRQLVMWLWAALAMGCVCGAGAQADDPCAAVRCGAGLHCDPLTARCAGESTDAGLLDGGIDASGSDAGSACAASCSDATPVCDQRSGRCVTCTLTEGCSGATSVCWEEANQNLGRCMACTPSHGCEGLTPACDVSAFPAGACVACLQPEDCPVSGSVCNLDTHACERPTPMPSFGDGGVGTHCLTQGQSRSCGDRCPAGFECGANGLCQLNGGGGAVQVTLRFDQPEDLDLHVDEPLSDGGVCEVFYGQPGTDPNAPFQPPFVRNCGAKSWLDLDSNRACNVDNVDIENIIWSPGVTPTSGEYVVRVDFYEQCSATTPIPYEVEVRLGTQRRYYCGSFQPGISTGGNSGAGVEVTRFWLP